MEACLIGSGPADTGVDFPHDGERDSDGECVLLLRNRPSLALLAAAVLSEIQQAQGGYTGNVEIQMSRCRNYSDIDPKQWPGRRYVIFVDLLRYLDVGYTDKAAERCAEQCREAGHTLVYRPGFRGTPLEVCSSQNEISLREQTIGRRVVGRLFPDPGYSSFALAHASDAVACELGVPAAVKRLQTAALASLSPFACERCVQLIDSTTLMRDLLALCELSTRLTAPWLANDLSSYGWRHRN